MLTRAPSTLKQRTLAILREAVKDSDFDPMLQRIGVKMIENFLKNADDATLRAQLLTMKDEILPFLLTDENPDTNG